MGELSDIKLPATMHCNPANWTGGPLRVCEVAVYRGPHLYSQTKMIRLQLDLGLLEHWPTDRLAGFSGRLLEALPGLRNHHCSLGHEGGLVQRLKDGTWLGHVIEHVALELQSEGGAERITRGKTRSVKGRPGVYNVMYAYSNEEVGLLAGRVALELVASLIGGMARLEGAAKVHAGALPTPFDLAACLDLLRAQVRRTRLGPTTAALVAEAERRGIPWQRLDENSLIQFGTGKRQKRIRASITSETSHVAVETAGNKDLTKRVLDAAGLPVPKGGLATTAEEAQLLALGIGYPITIKPLNANHGRGVSTDLRDAPAVAAAFALAQTHGMRVVVEQHYFGRDHRILVVDGKLAAVAQRVPAHVVGNGVDTVRSLIEAVNRDPRRGDGHEEVTTRIAIDAATEAYLARVGLNLDSVPALGVDVVLCATANLSTGGTAIDRSDTIHPDNARAAERAARIIGLDIAGIDMVIPDIARSWREVGGGIVEVNAAPGFRMHLSPTQGESRKVAQPVLAMLFPKARQARIPVVAITGTNGKSTTTRMVVEILRHGGASVGFSSTTGLYIDDDCLWKGDASGPRSARRLLRDATIDYAVLETARGGILREGLGFDYCTVGAVLNVSEDHLGLNGIDTLKDLAGVKSVVSEAVGRRGVSVLNADDPLTRNMARRAGGRVCFFSMRGVEALRAHIEKNGMAVVCERSDGGDEIAFYRDGRRETLMSVAEIPATLAGAARFNIENALAAAAIGLGLDIAPTQIRAGLAAFASTFERNPGRLNIHDAHGFRVLMDYAHNPAAMRALVGVVRALRDNHGRVIATVSTPGDRRDEDISEIGAIVAHDFDLLTFRELPDNRGRPPGEGMRLMREGALAAGCPTDRIRCVADEIEAAILCLRQARPGDLVVLTPSDIDAVWAQVLAFRPAFADQSEESATLSLPAIDAMAVEDRYA